MTISQEISAGAMVSPLEPFVPHTMLARDPAVFGLEVYEVRRC